MAEKQAALMAIRTLGKLDIEEVNRDTCRLRRAGAPQQWRAAQR